MDNIFLSFGLLLTLMCSYQYVLVNHNYVIWEMFRSFFYDFPGPYFGIRKNICSASTGKSASTKNCRTMSSIYKVFCHLELAITAYHFPMSSSSETGGDKLYYTLFILVWSSLLPDFVSSVPYLEDSVLLQSLTLSSKSLIREARYFSEGSPA